MNKLNPQPEPPAPWDIFGWFAYLFDWVMWAIAELFGVDSPIAD